METKYSNIDKNNLKSLISKCSINYCNKIYDVLALENIKMTKNNNGYFFNLSNISDNTIDKIKYILSIEEKKETANIETEYNKYTINCVPIKRDIVDIQSEEDNETIEETVNDTEIETGTLPTHSIINENDNDLEQYEDEEEDDEESKLICKKNDYSNYLNRIIKKCKEIQRNNEIDYIDINDDYDDSEIVYEHYTELDFDNTYTE